MAIVVVNYEKQEPLPPPAIESVTVTLSVLQAKTLVTILGSIGGVGPIRTGADDLRNCLKASGIHGVCPHMVDVFDVSVHGLYLKKEFQ